MDYFVYILKSQKDGNYYTGISANIKNRVKQHNSGKTKSTRYRRPFKLIYKEKHNTLEGAREREKFLKSYSGVAEKKRIIDEFDKV
ncbi:GIY-YIG nuclease family protein [Patescibacteria group bacterium]|nr:GIY-YIG nuclease family protein [Patescibacteria group bacterium]